VSLSSDKIKQNTHPYQQDHSEHNQEVKEYWTQLKSIELSSADIWDIYRKREGNIIKQPELKNNYDQHNREVWEYFQKLKQSDPGEDIFDLKTPLKYEHYYAVGKQVDKYEKKEIKTISYKYSKKDFTFSVDICLILTEYGKLCITRVIKNGDSPLQSKNITFSELLNKLPETIKQPELKNKHDQHNRKVWEYFQKLKQSDPGEDIFDLETRLKYEVKNHCGTLKALWHKKKKATCNGEQCQRNILIYLIVTSDGKYTIFRDPMNNEIIKPIIKKN
jgi:hypothetical protein